MQRNIFVSCFFTVAVCTLTIGFVMVINAEAQPPAVKVEINAPPPPAVQVEVQQPAAELPPEEYIPEGNPTPPPPLAVKEPELVVVPSGEVQVYMVPNMVGVYFYGGSWYRFHHGVWFRAGIYSDPWVVVAPAIVPRFVVGISPAYALHLPPTYHRIHYGEFHSNWRTWERERHWQHERWFQNERRADVRRERERQAHASMEKERHMRQERIKSDKVGYKNRLADPARYNKPTPSDKTGKIGRTGKIDRTSKIDRTGPTGVQKTGQVGVQKTGRVVTQKPGSARVQRTDRVGTQKTGPVSKQPKPKQMDEKQSPR